MPGFPSPTRRRHPLPSARRPEPAAVAYGPGTLSPPIHCQLRGKVDEATERLAWEIIGLLSARFRRIPERQRPHYSPSQRFRALEIRSLLGWSRDLAARVFLVCPNTVSNWERSADPLARSSGSSVKPIPPVRRFADAVRATVNLMARCGFGGEDAIVLTLARAGWTVSAGPFAGSWPKRLGPLPRRPPNPLTR